jgi:multidrug resistance efflux pump
MMRRRNRRRALKWVLWVVGVLGLAVAVLALIKIDDVVMAQGIVDPGRKEYIDSPMSRVIKEIYVQPGTPVKVGDPLVRLYDADLISDVAETEKEVQRAEANLEFARAHLALLREKPTAEELRIAESEVEQAKISLEARKQELTRAEHLYLGERLWSREDLERAKTNHELARTNLKVAGERLNLVRRGASPAEIQQAEASVRQATAALDKARHSHDAAVEALELATLESPVDGVVVRRDLHPGMMASAGTIILIIAGDSGGTVIDAWVPETNAWKIRLGQSVEILSNLFSDREEFLGLGRISKFYGYAVHSGGTRTFELEVAVEDTPMPLRYGSTADLRIIVGRRSILKILLGIENRDFVQTSRSEGVTGITGSQYEGPQARRGTPAQGDTLAPPATTGEDSAAAQPQ